MSRTRSTTSSTVTSATKHAYPSADPLKTASLAAHFVTALFETETSSSVLRDFTVYALYRTQLEQPVVLTALVLLHRLKTRFPSVKGSCGERLVLASLMLASKELCDDTFSTASWAEVSKNRFSIGEVNQMERELLSYLDWKIRVEQAEIDILLVTLTHASVQSSASQPPPLPPHPRPQPVEVAPTCSSPPLTPSSCASAVPGFGYSPESSPGSQPCTPPSASALPIPKKSFEQREPRIAGSSAYRFFWGS